VILGSLIFAFSSSSFDWFTKSEFAYAKSVEI